MRRENVVGLSAEQEVERFGKHLAHGFSHRIVEIGDSPATIFEATDGSSCGPPGACIISSRLTNAPTMIFLICALLRAVVAVRHAQRTCNGGECRHYPEKICEARFTIGTLSRSAQGPDCALAGSATNVKSGAYATALDAKVRSVPNLRSAALQRQHWAVSCREQGQYSRDSLPIKFAYDVRRSSEPKRKLRARGLDVARPRSTCSEVGSPYVVWATTHHRSLTRPASHFAAAAPSAPSPHR